MKHPVVCLSVVTMIATCSDLPLSPSTSAHALASQAALCILDWNGKKGAVSWSFDDAQPSQIEHWGELKAAHVPMTFYAVKAHENLPGARETWREVLALGSEIGNHTATHRYWEELGGKGAQRREAGLAELDLCSSWIRDDLGALEVTTFAHPYGDTFWNGAARKRFALARTVNGGLIRPLDTTDPLLLPAFMARGGESAGDLLAEIDRAKVGGAWLIMVFHSLLPTSHTWYAGVDINAVTASMEGARAGGDLWLDTVANIGAYWLGQRIFDRSRPEARDGKLVWSWELPDHFPCGRHLRATLKGGTLSQQSQALPREADGSYLIALDARQLVWAPGN